LVDDCYHPIFSTSDVLQIIVAFHGMSRQENSEDDNGQINEPMFTYKHF
jgi:hypothetical protein